MPSAGQLAVLRETMTQHGTEPFRGPIGPNGEAQGVADTKTATAIDGRRPAEEKVAEAIVAWAATLNF
jgi:hypothetical protein